MESLQRGNQKAENEKKRRDEEKKQKQIEFEILNLTEKREKVAEIFQDDEETGKPWNERKEFEV